MIILFSEKWTIRLKTSTPPFRAQDAATDLQPTSTQEHRTYFMQMALLWFDSERQLWLIYGCLNSRWQGYFVGGNLRRQGLARGGESLEAGPLILSPCFLAAMS